MGVCPPFVKGNPFTFQKTKGHSWWERQQLLCFGVLTATSLACCPFLASFWAEYFDCLNFGGKQKVQTLVASLRCIVSCPFIALECDNIPLLSSFSLTSQSVLPSTTLVTQSQSQGQAPGRCFPAPGGHCDHPILSLDPVVFGEFIPIILDPVKWLHSYGGRGCVHGAPCRSNEGPRSRLLRKSSCFFTGRRFPLGQTTAVSDE